MATKDSYGLRIEQKNEQLRRLADATGKESLKDSIITATKVDGGTVYSGATNPNTGTRKETFRRDPIVKASKTNTEDTTPTGIDESQFGTSGESFRRVNADGTINEAPQEGAISQDFKDAYSESAKTQQELADELGLNIKVNQSPAERAEELLKKQEADRLRMEEEIALSNQKKNLQDRITSDKLTRTEASAESNFGTGLNEIGSKAQTELVKGFSTGVTRQLDLIDIANKQYDIEIEKLREQAQTAAESGQESLLKSIGNQIDSFEERKAEQAQKRADVLAEGEKELTNTILKEVDIENLDDAQLLNLVQSQGGTQTTYTVLKGIRDGKIAAGVSSGDTASIQAFARDMIMPQLASGIYNNYGTDPNVRKSLQTALSQTGLSLDTVLPLIDAIASGDENAIAFAKKDIKDKQDEKTTAAITNTKKIQELLSEGNTKGAKMLADAVGIDLDDIVGDKDILNNQQADLDMVMKLNKIPNGETYTGGGRDADQCGEFTKDVAGLKQGVGDSLKEKLNDERWKKEGYVRVDTPVPGAIFVTSSGAPLKNGENTGHIGFITSVNGDLVSTKESNHNGSGVVGERKNIDLKTDGLEAYYVKEENIDKGIMGTLGVPISFERQIKSQVPTQLQNSEVELTALNDTIKRLSKAGISTEDAALTFMGFDINIPTESKKVATKLIDTAKQLGDKLPESYVANISNFINKGDLPAAVRTTERIVKNAMKEELGNNLINEPSAKFAQQSFDLINTFIDKNSDKIGPISGRLSSLESKFADDPDFQKLKTLISGNLAEIRRTFGGTAVTETELSALRDFVGLDVNMPVENLRTGFQTNLDQKVSELNAQRNEFGLPSLDRNSLLDFDNKVNLYKGIETPKKSAETPEEVDEEIKQIEIDDINSQLEEIERQLSGQ